MSAYPNGNMRRVSSLKPSLRGVQNASMARLRAAGHSPQHFAKFTGRLAVFIGFLAFLGLWMGGVLPNVGQGLNDWKQSRLMAAGFTVKSVDVIGEGRLDERAVRRALGVRPGDYLFTLDMAAAQTRIRQLPWVEHVVIRRLWPDRIVVQIIERTPQARWQVGGRFTLIDAEGTAIAEVTPDQFADLDLIVGPEANTQWAGLSAQLAGHPRISERLVAGVYLNAGTPSARWDLVLNGVRVKLPAGQTGRAISDLAGLQSRTQVLDRDIGTIDLRVPGRATFAAAQDTPV